MLVSIIIPMLLTWTWTWTEHFTLVEPVSGTSKLILLRIYIKANKSYFRKLRRKSQRIKTAQSNHFLFSQHLHRFLSFIFQFPLFRKKFLVEILSRLKWKIRNNKNINENLEKINAYEAETCNCSKSGR